MTQYPNNPAQTNPCQPWEKLGDPNPNLRAAQYWAGQGFRVFPLEPGTKTPLPGSRGEKDATTDTIQIINWWDQHPGRGIGICPTPGRHLFVDIDVKSGATGDETWQELCNAYGEPPPTITIVTPSGGWHYLYTIPEGIDIQSANGRIGPGVDHRSRTGYFVAAPTMVETGGLFGRYVCVSDHTIAQAPEWLIAAAQGTLPPLGGARHGNPPTAALRPVVTAGDVTGRLNALADELAAAPHGQGNSTAARLAFMAGGYVGAGQLTENEATNALIGAITGWSYQQPSDQAAMERTIRAQVREGAKHPRPWEPPHQTIGGGVDLPTDLPDPVAGPQPALDPTLWETRPTLQAVYQAAHRWETNPAGVLAALLAQTSSWVPPEARVETGKGSPISLNYYAMVAAPSGVGKSSAMSAAEHLLSGMSKKHDEPMSGYPKANYPIKNWALPVGTGQGLVQAYCGMVDTDEGGKMPAQIFRHAYFRADEGEGLTTHIRKSDSILGDTLRRGWLAEIQGQTNAKVENTRRLGAHTYALGLVVGYQPAKMRDWFEAETDGGTCQRFLYAPAVWPELPDTLTGIPEALPVVEMPKTTIVLPDHIQRELHAERLEVVRGNVTINPLDSHLAVLKVKTAALLSILDGRMGDVTDDDWHLAGAIIAVSCRFRDWIIDGHAAEAAREAEEKDQAKAASQLRVAATIRETLTQGAEELADTLMKHIANGATRWAGKPSMGGLAQRLSGRKRSDRDLIDRAFMMLLEDGKISIDNDDWRTGTIACEK